MLSACVEDSRRSNGRRGSSDKRINVREAHSSDSRKSRFLRSFHSLHALSRQLKVNKKHVRGLVIRFSLREGVCNRHRITFTTEEKEICD